MKISTKYFGEIEIEKDKVITFPDGIPGFEQEKKFVIINNPDKDNPFNWLQSINDITLVFIIINPFLIVPNYEVELSESILEKLNIENQKEVAIYTIAVVPKNIKDITVNFAGPLIINVNKKLGKQIVLDNNKYSTKHYIFRQNKEDEGE